MRLATAVLFVTLCSGGIAQEQSLFNAKDLTGWDGKLDCWRVEDSALTCESTEAKPCKNCHYLFWKGSQPADFELSVDFRISRNANSGIQFRSQILPEWDTYGYQADMTGDGGYVGFIYYQKGGIHEFLAKRGEKARFAPEGSREEDQVARSKGKTPPPAFTPAGKREVETLGEPKELLKGFKVEDWNTYRIVCRGHEITLYLNGVMMSQAVDQFPPRVVPNGFIALQMHPGHEPIKIQFKNIILKEQPQETKP